VAVTSWTQELQELVAGQVDYITSQASAARRAEIGLVTAGGGVDFMYAEGQILVRDSYLDRVLDVLADGFTVGAITPLTPGAALVRIALRGDPAASGQHAEAAGRGSVPHPYSGQPPSVLTALSLIDSAVGEGAAAPDHLLTVAPVVAPCPATEPAEADAGTEPVPGVRAGASGQGVLVYVADTGLLESAPSVSWLDGVRRAVAPGGELQDWDPCPADTGTEATLTPYSGHGTFVAGVTRCLAPQADVIVSNVFNSAGSALESDFIADLNTGLAEGVDLFNLAVTTPTRKRKPMLAFAAWLETLRDYKGVTCVVAAGNSGSRQPSWPAAFSGVISVGALGADWRSRASFSNHGGWVDVYAPGRDLVNAYATGTYICHDVPYRGQRRDFYGMARWSGTSFATPVVTGLIADRMSKTGENAREAGGALLAQAREAAIPGTGAILLPG
jgi:hypothetical protein